MLTNGESALPGESAQEATEKFGQRRLLVRLWLAMEDGRPLSFGFDRGVNHDGVARGGVPHFDFC